MESQIHYLAALAFVDRELDELHEEFGDLPDIVRQKEDKYKSLQAMADETESILHDIRSFVSTSKITLVEMKEKEEGLAKQQFLVRNNKEFDAVSKEIEFLKAEHEKLSTKMRSEGMKEENLQRIQEQQKADAAEAKKDFEDRKSEYDTLSSEQSVDIKKLNDTKNKIISFINDNIYSEYQRIRRFHKDTAVQVRKDSCTGCFSSIPSQKIVELRNNLDTVYFCENCGRILISEDVPVEEHILDEIL